uniref:RING-type E3 ubiquitin transferase n=1 Tax=Saccoglossus kowalevskii TaxID=10224 RepID=A0ABM0H1U7_SACKO|nr:PREDICTED: uncharacterized protein LOC100368311 [Saccoglossus kowalevskii]
MSHRKSIIVTGIPSGASRDQLQIYFQRSSNGGGDVTSVVYPLNPQSESMKDVAMVTFDKEEDCQRVLSKVQTLNSTLLEVKPLPPQVFSNLSATVNADLLKTIPPAKVKNLIESVQQDYGIHCKYRLDDSKSLIKFELKGNWHQLSLAQKLLQKYCPILDEESLPVNGYASSDDPKSLRHVSNGPDQEHSLGQRLFDQSQRNGPLSNGYSQDQQPSFETSSINGNRSIPVDSQNSAHMLKSREATGQRPRSRAGRVKGSTLFSKVSDHGDAIMEQSEDQMSWDLEPDHDTELLFSRLDSDVVEDKVDRLESVSSPVPVDVDFYKYLNHTQSQQLLSIEQEFDVKFVCDLGSDAGILQILPGSSNTTKDQIQMANESFIVLYENLFRTTTKFDLLLPTGFQHADLVEKTVEDTHKRYSKVFMKFEEANHYAMYGDKDILERAKSHVPKADQLDANQSDWLADGRISQNALKRSVTILSDGRRELSFLTESGIKVRLYCADITKLNVDTITNAAHEQLINTGGVAYSIRKAAGRQYHRECEEYIDNHGPLYVTEVIHTGAGELPCKDVMHAVGPRWEDYKNKIECLDTLRATFVNCLKHANDLLQATSVAIPPISAGIFGVPLDMVAQGMFDAVMEFSEKHSRDKGNRTLSDIHYVDYEMTTVTDMRKVFMENLKIMASGELPEARLGSLVDVMPERSASPIEDIRARPTSPVQSTQEQIGRPGTPPVSTPPVWSNQERIERPGTPPVRTSQERVERAGTPVWSNQERIERPGTPPVRTSQERTERAGTPPVWSNQERIERPGTPPVRTSLDVPRASSPRPTEDVDRRPASPRGTSAFKQFKVTAEIDKYLPTRSFTSPRSGIFGERIRPSTRPLTAERHRRHQTENSTLKPMRATHDGFDRDRRIDDSELGAVGGDNEKVLAASDKEALVREILDEHDHGPLTNERYYQTQRRLEKLLLEDEFSPIKGSSRHRTRSMDRSRPRTADVSRGSSGRASSLDRRKPLTGSLDLGSTVSKRCQLCRSSKNLTTLPSCSHYICRTCKTMSTNCYDCLQTSTTRDKGKLKVQATSFQPSLTRAEAKQRLAQKPKRSSSASARFANTQSPLECPICMERVSDPKMLQDCQHTFCRACIDRALKDKPVCPVCGLIYGTLTGSQPDGTMNTTVDKLHSLPGYTGYGTIVIVYEFPDGIQTEKHPNPGKAYQGTKRRAYLPDSVQGREVLRLLKKAFQMKLLFTVGQSVTTGLDNVVIWNDIHQKTSRHGGPANHGYPDPFYLRRVKEELAAKGVK